MSAVELRAEILRLLQHESNEGVLAMIRSLLKRDEQGGEFDISDEELAELEEIDRRRKAGLDTYVTLEEAMRMIRAGRRS